MRPKSIVIFERLMFASIVLSPIQGIANWASLKEALQLSPIMLILLSLFGLALFLIITLFISRKRSNIVKWFWVVCCIFGLISYFTNLTLGKFLGVPFIYILQGILQYSTLIFLFTKSSRDWFKRPKAVMQ
jgi:hypothetical protein